MTKFPCENCGQEALDNGFYYSDGRPHARSGPARSANVAEFQWHRRCGMCFGVVGAGELSFVEAVRKTGQDRTK